MQNCVYAKITCDHELLTVLAYRSAVVVCTACRSTHREVTYAKHNCAGRRVPIVYSAMSITIIIPTMIVCTAVVLLSIDGGRVTIAPSSEILIRPDDYSNSSVLERLIGGVVDELSPYRIVLIVAHNSHASVDAVERFLIGNYPTVLLDQRHLDELRVSLNRGSPRYSCLFVLLSSMIGRSSEEDRLDAIFSEMSALLDAYVDMVPRTIRPRWLNLFLKSDLDEVDDDAPYIEQFLRYAWDKKFLDFTVIETTLTLDHPIRIHSYNPFTDLYEMKLIDYRNDCDMELAPLKRLFPDKLHNMRGYPLRTIFVPEVPSLVVERNSTGHSIYLSGPDYWLLATVFRELNVTMISLPTRAQRYSHSHTTDPEDLPIYQAMKLGLIDVSGNQLYLWLDKNVTTERGMLFRTDSYCAMVPNLVKSQVEVSRKFYAGVAFTLIVSLVVVRFAKLLRFDAGVWQGSNVFRLLIGFSIPRPSSVLRERLVLGSILFVAMSYSTIYYARLTNRSLRNYGRVPFRSFRDLWESGLVPLVFEPFFATTFDAHERVGKDPWVRLLKQRAQRVTYSFAECVERQLAQPSLYSCLLPETMGHDVERRREQENSWDDGQAKIRVMHPCFWKSWKGFVLAPGSPYVEKFDRLFVRIVEAGLIGLWQHNYSRSARIKDRIRYDKKDRLESAGLRKQLALIVGVGYALATIAFAAEFIVRRVNN
ncbi:unnamed protein product [Trichogramma brassicae]|uniref:Ionotropic glutamate receptor L-glutamate and glycine-binding domain-containing protein n=1 Tax=Trichogramma brassicae TaxID=86971 RepID=A0A6H5IDX6_9HYME|nr:unnamed protein product [Trichogramma brassicae]